MPKIDVNNFLDKKYNNLISNVNELMKELPDELTPHLATILVGDRKDSEVYVRNKEKAIDKAGMTSETIKIKNGTPFADIARTILTLNKNTAVNGILLQLPLDRNYYSKQEEDTLIALIDDSKDVDGLNYLNQAHLFMGKDMDTFLTPCTPTGIVQLIKEQYDSTSNDLTALDITVVGRSQLLGNSLAQMLMRENANVTLLHSKSGWDMEDYLAMNSVDILCLCAGSVNLVAESDLDPDQDYMIIDAAMNVGEDGKLRGDLCKEDYPKFDDRERFCKVDYTSVPGGVGPITTFTLAYNLYKATCLQNKMKLRGI